MAAFGSEIVILRRGRHSYFLAFAGIEDEAEKALAYGEFVQGLAEDLEDLGFLIISQVFEAFGGLLCFQDIL